MGNNSKIFLAALTGAVVGAGIALLIAPASGEDTREKIGDKFNDAKDALVNKGQEALEKLRSHS